MGACAVCERDGTGGEMEPELVVALAVDEGGSTGAEAYMPVERLMADSPSARRRSHHGDSGRDAPAGSDTASGRGVSTHGRSAKIRRSVQLLGQRIARGMCQAVLAAKE
jgi:hypothetical protein